MRSSVLRGNFFFLSKDFPFVGIKEIVVIVVLGQPCVSRTSGNGAGAGMASGLRSDHVAWMMDHGLRTMAAAAMASAYSSLSTVLGRGFSFVNKTAGIHVRPSSISLSRFLSPATSGTHPYDLSMTAC